MKNVILMLCLFCCFICGWAQNDTDLKSKINDVKKSNKYFYAEATMPDKDKALSVAKEQLVLKINSWLKSKQNYTVAEPLVFEKIQSKTETADMKRGNNMRVFIYVDKSDIILIRGLNAIVLNEDERKIEQEQPAPPEEIDPLQSIYDTKTMAEMKTVFSELKEKKAIVYGEYPAENAPKECYVLFYTQTGSVKGVVLIDKNKILWNAQTNKEVKGSDFNGCRAYWFTLKNKDER